MPEISFQSKRVGYGMPLSHSMSVAWENRERPKQHECAFPSLIAQLSREREREPHIVRCMLRRSGIKPFWREFLLGLPECMNCHSHPSLRISPKRASVAKKCISIHGVQIYIGNPAVECQASHGRAKRCLNDLFSVSGLGKKTCSHFPLFFRKACIGTFLLFLI